uniref:Sushi domain-containing protein n=1 Tax=Naja naja TaxID=35670 RepID=A0A8C6X729_NAJNA
MSARISFFNILYDLFSLEITCNPPSILNGFFKPQRTIYRNGDLIRIQCDSGFTLETDNRGKVFECTKNGWSPSLKCVNIEGGCGRPPAVDNADIVEMLKETYIQSESITYQCQNLYIMEGSARVTCQNGRWSKAPICTGRWSSLGFASGSLPTSLVFGGSFLDRVSCGFLLIFG